MIQLILTISLVLGGILTIVIYGGIIWADLRNGKKHSNTKKAAAFALLISASGPLFPQPPQTGYLLVITTFKPYKATPYTFATAEEADTLLNKNVNAGVFLHIEDLLSYSNHYYIQTDNVKIEIERKEIKEIRNGEVILRRRKYKSN